MGTMILIMMAFGVVIAFSVLSNKYKENKIRERQALRIDRQHTRALERQNIRHSQMIERTKLKGLHKKDFE